MCRPALLCVLVLLLSISSAAAQSAEPPPAGLGAPPAPGAGAQPPVAQPPVANSPGPKPPPQGPSYGAPPPSPAYGAAQPPPAVRAAAPARSFSDGLALRALLAERDRLRGGRVRVGLPLGFFFGGGVAVLAGSLMIARTFDSRPLIAGSILTAFGSVAVITGMFWVPAAIVVQRERKRRLHEIEKLLRGVGITSLSPMVPLRRGAPLGLQTTLRF